MNAPDGAPDRDESAATADDGRDATAPLMRSVADAVDRSRRAMRESGELQPGSPASLASGATPLAGASPDLLANAGLAVLRDALAGGNDRSAAFELLTADALITAACEAAAIGELPASLSARHFLAMMESS